MNKLKIKDNKNRTLFKKKELNLRVLKGLQNNYSLFLGVRWKALKKESVLNVFYRTSTKINNRCIETVSKKSFNKKIKLSRLEFLRKVRSGLVSGFKKSVW